MKITYTTTRDATGAPPDERKWRMLFHIKQWHEPQHCPFGKGGSTSLFDGDAKDVKIHGYWLAFPQHTTYLIVETDDVARLQAFLKPGAAGDEVRDHARQRQACTIPLTGPQLLAHLLES